MQLTKGQMLKRWQRAVNYRERVWLRRRKPKFHLAQEVKVVTREPDLGSWTYMDPCRKERKGQRGIIVDMDSLPDSDVPEQYSNYSYRVRFDGGREIVFSEEHLTRAR
jgi:hypothetical protein